MITTFLNNTIRGNVSLNHCANFFVNQIQMRFFTIMTLFSTLSLALPSSKEKSFQCIYSPDPHADVPEETFLKLPKANDESDALNKCLKRYSQCNICHGQKVSDESNEYVCTVGKAYFGGFVAKLKTDKQRFIDVACSKRVTNCNNCYVKLV